MKQEIEKPQNKLAVKKYHRMAAELHRLNDELDDLRALHLDFERMVQENQARITGVQYQIEKVKVEQKRLTREL